MKRLLFALTMAALGLFAMTSAAFALSLSVTPWTYSHGANSGEGVFGNPPVTSKCAAAVVTTQTPAPTAAATAAPTASTGQLAQTGGGAQFPIGMLLGSGFLLIGLAAIAVRRQRLN